MGVAEAWWEVTRLHQTRMFGCIDWIWVSCWNEGVVECVLTLQTDSVRNKPGVSSGAWDQKGKSRQIQLYCKKGTFLADERSGLNVHIRLWPQITARVWENKTSSDRNLYVGRGTEEEEEEEVQNQGRLTKSRLERETSSASSSGSSQTRSLMLENKRDIQPKALVFVASF